MEYKGFTYTPTPKTAWDNLSMLEKSEMMKVAVRNGITDLKTIKEQYNEFAEGGNIYSGDEEETQQMKVSKSPHVDLAISNPWLYQKLHPAKRKAEKYEPTTFAGRITQLAGASELGQKYADYTSSAIQQVPVVGLVPSALDLGYDTNKLYHNPSLTATKDVTLDAASLVPALRKTMKGWWMKGNSGSFITETGQIINNPRVASTLEVTLQPFRTAINTGVYGARAADFLDDSKAYLKEMYNSSKIGKHFPIKALGGPLVEAAMNEYANGGGIHIAPSKKGTFTAAAKKHGKSVQAFASQVLAHPENYSPAMRRKANFARNAAKWHGEGGPLQGPIVDMAMANNQSDVNLYGWGDWLDKAYNGVKNAVNKGREVVRTLGLDKSPSNHLMSWMGVSDSDMTNKNQSKNNNLGFFATGALDAGRMSGINKVVKGDKNDIHYRTNLFNMVDPTNAVPDNIIDVLGHAITASQAKSGKTYPYKREHQDATADAAWAKRLGLPYDKTLLPDNTDGSVRLSQALEQEIPTDTTLLKNRIAENEKLLTKIYGKKRKPIKVAVDLDKAALNALRKTYSTGKPVELNEFTHNSRGWLDADLDKVVTPLSLLHRYTVQYDKDNNRMNYWDTYDFDEFEDFVPGEPFFIRGSIDLNKKK